MTDLNHHAAHPIPLVDLQRQYLSLLPEMDRAIAEVVRSGSYILGEPLAAFEREFAEFCGARSCIGVANGTDALQLSFRALGIGPGDEVIIPAHTFAATPLAVLACGALPVLVDVDPNTFLVDLNLIEEKISARTKAICVVHLYGRILPMVKILSLAKEHGLSVVEDAAQAHGAAIDGRQAGTWGELGCFSFYPGKNLGAYGDGGAVVTSDDKLAERLKRLRNYGSETKYHYLEEGTNSRLDNLQAAILSVKLPKLRGWNLRRAEIATAYDRLLREKNKSSLVLPELPPAGEHVFHLYVVQVPDRDRVLDALQKSGIGAGVHYPRPFHLEPAFSRLRCERGSFPVTERLCGRIISLPLFPELTDNELGRVVEVLAAELS